MNCLQFMKCGVSSFRSQGRGERKGEVASQIVMISCEFSTQVSTFSIEHVDSRLAIDNDLNSTKALK